MRLVFRPACTKDLGVPQPAPELGEQAGLAYPGLTLDEGGLGLVDTRALGEFG